MFSAQKSEEKIPGRDTALCRPHPQNKPELVKKLLHISVKSETNCIISTEKADNVSGEEHSPQISSHSLPPRSHPAYLRRKRKVDAYDNYAKNKKKLTSSQLSLPHSAKSEI